MKKLLGKLENEIIDENNLTNCTDTEKNVTTEVDENGVKVKLVYVVQEKIGTKEKIQN